MIIIADSGSTKTDWKIVENQGQISHVGSIGFNPVLIDTELIINELRNIFPEKKTNEKVKAVYYYGAGCWNEEMCLVVKKALVVIFPKAKIEVNNDLLGAAKAVCGNFPGIACILGTGANSCSYDGKKILDSVPALGYILGDEGSGAYLGKQLIRSYFYRELPVELKEKLEAQYDISKKNILKKIYSNKAGNRYLASYARFLVEEKEDPYCKKLIETSFDIFIKRHVLKYKDIRNLPIHFIGSIAYFLQDILKETVENNQLNFGKIIRQPIDGLVDFHSLMDNG